MNLHKNPLEIIDKPTKKIINIQIDIKLGQFTEEERNAVQKKLKPEKLQTSIK